MFSGDGFSEDAFSVNDHVDADSSAFQAFLARVLAERCWVLEIDALSLAPSGALSGGFSEGGFSESGFGDDDSGSAGGQVTLRWSTHGYTSQHTDTPASTHFESRLKDGFKIQRDIAGKYGVGGLARVFAEVFLANSDGSLDGLLNDYAIDGRPARLLVGDPAAAFADFGKVFSGVVAQTPNITETMVRFSLSDGQAKLELPVHSNKYQGSGGLEGGADLKGKNKPLCYGRCRNVSPVLVDALNLIYQVHDGAIQDVPAVRDRAVALNKVVGVPAPGEYAVDVLTGTFQLGASPDGEITCDVEGDAPISGYSESLAAVALRLLSGKLYTSEIDTTAFANLNTVISAPVGLWTGVDDRTTADALDELLYGAGCFGGFSRIGIFTVGRIAAPTDEAPVLELDESMIGAIERQPLPEAFEPVVWRASVGWGRNHTVQTDIAALAADADRAFAAEQWRVAAEEDAGIKSRHLLAQEFGPVPSPFAEEADADIEAARLFSLWGSSNRALLKVPVPLEAMSADIGRVVQLRHPRHRLTPSRPARVIGQTIKSTGIELRVIV